jgi:hypothetical protein
MATTYYLLIEDVCNVNSDSNAHVDYVYFGTFEEVYNEMKRLYEETVDDGWDNRFFDDVECDNACVSMDASVLGYDCHIAWSTVGCGPIPNRGGMSVVVKGHAFDGDVEIELLDAFARDEMATQRMMEAFGKELAKPSFYPGWDPDYCDLDSDHALATVETMDEVVQFDIIRVVAWNGEIIHDIYRGFEYIG